MNDQFAIVEMMGHRRFGARVTEVERFGAKCMRAEILSEGPTVEQYVFPGSIYAVTMCTEPQARAVNTKWSLQSAVPMLPAEVAPGTDDDGPDIVAHCETCGDGLTEDEVHYDAEGVPFCKEDYEALKADPTSTIERAPGFRPVGEPGACNSCSKPLAADEGVMDGDMRLCRAGCVPF